MNTERLRELLAAAASGDLSGKANAGEKREVERLLRESESARALFQKLKADANRLAKLPRRAAPTDMADRVPEPHP